jgi:hypothetical protein
MRTPSHLALLCALLVTALPAHAALDVAWDCYLPNGPADCRVVETAFFSNPAYVRAVEGGEVDASLTMRSARMADGTRVEIGVTDKDGARLVFNDRIPRGFSNNAVVLRMVGVLQKSTAHLFVVEEPAVMADGVLSLRLRDPDAGPRSAVQADETTLWYVAPNVNFNAERYGITQLRANGWLDVNWSHPHWRLRGGAWAGYRLVLTDPVTGNERPEDLRYEAIGGGTDWVVARSLLGGFSLAANAYVMHEPKDNYQLLAGTWLGAEWVLVPFLKTDEGNFGVQYVIGAEHHEYVLPNVLLLRSYDYMRHRVRVFGAWHFSRVDVDGRIGATSHVTDPRFSSVSGYGGITWRVLDNFSMSLNGEVSYRNALLNQPKNEAEENPLAKFFGGGSYSDVTFWSWIGLEYTFGNSLLKRQDQRWN